MNHEGENSDRSRRRRMTALTTDDTTGGASSGCEEPQGKGCLAGDGDPQNQCCTAVRQDESLVSPATDMVVVHTPGGPSCTPAEKDGKQAKIMRAVWRVGYHMLLSRTLPSLSQSAKAYIPPS